MNQNIDDAVLQIAEIHKHLARSVIFRGYRAQTAAVSGILALLTALAQTRFMPEPMLDLAAWLMLWCGAAFVSLAILGIELTLRCCRLASPMQKQQTLEAVERFAPSLAAGALLTVVIDRFAIEQIWMLPGLWAMFFSLGIFSSRTLLPRGISVVAGFYLVAGLLCLAYGQDERALSPWLMGLTFGIGQLLAAIVLYWNLECEHG